MRMDIAAFDKLKSLISQRLRELWHANDAGIFSTSALYRRLIEGGLNLPAATVLPGSTIKSPYFFAGDGAFPLLTNLMKPFGGTNLTHQQRIYNYR
uniref:DDE Tnp4 domain-containing protein n=1 Tax=Ditylenchus dipsaci TaxID=166011 RepID=A0A915EGX4_9BILA